MRKPSRRACARRWKPRWKRPSFLTTKAADWNTSAAEPPPEEVAVALSGDSDVWLASCRPAPARRPAWLSRLQTASLTTHIADLDHAIAELTATGSLDA